MAIDSIKIVGVYNNILFQIFNQPFQSYFSFYINKVIFFQVMRQVDNI